jgi:hypothetical protein
MQIVLDLPDQTVPQYAKAVVRTINTERVINHQLGFKIATVVVDGSGMSIDVTEARLVEDYDG